MKYRQFWSQEYQYFPFCHVFTLHWFLLQIHMSRNEKEANLKLFLYKLSILKVLENRFHNLNCVFLLLIVPHFWLITKVNQNCQRHDKWSPRDKSQERRHHWEWKMITRSHQWWRASWDPDLCLLYICISVFARRIYSHL